jgi:hypothetical protein
MTTLNSGDNIMINKYLALAMTIAPLSLVGCGDSGTGSSNNSTSTTGTGTGIVYGRIDGFGSIHIDNRRLITDSNTLVVIGDDNPKIWDDSMMTDGTLKAGQIAMVREDNGHADRVTVDENVKGPVDSINPLVVMGQSIMLGAGTMVDNNCPADLLNAEVIEVYGLVDTSGAIDANIIECKTGAEVNHYSVIGAVSNLNGNTFKINSLTVDFSNADTSDLIGGQPQNGQLVQVKDDRKAYNGGSGDTLFATRVESQISMGALGSPNDHMEIESFVTDASGLPNSFRIGDLTINISASTTFLFGDVSLISNGVKLEAEGHINSSGELNADKIKFEDNDSRVDALVSSVDLNSNTITLLDDTVSVVIDGNTRMKDSITLQNISIDDSLEVRGFLGSNGKFVASEIKKGSQKTDRAELRSTASSIDATAGSMVLLGININTSSGTEFKDHNDTVISRAAFFKALVENVTTVQAKWDTYNGDVNAPVKELELEDD